MNAAIVREWLDHVEADLDAAWSCGRGPRARLDRAAYLLQQAAEELVKSVLVSAGIDPPRTHDIADLVAELREGTPFRDRLAARSGLTPYATGFRYPMPHEPPPLPSLLNSRPGSPRSKPLRPISSAGSAGKSGSSDD